MASLLSLSAELKLCIVEQLDLTSTSFIPTPPPDLVSLSQVCTVLRALALPRLYKSITLLNDEKSGSFAQSLFNNSFAHHVRTIHYIGVMAMTPNTETMEDSMELDNLLIKPSPDHLPRSVEHVLSHLAQFPNLERCIVDLRCAKTAQEDQSTYEMAFDTIEHPEDGELVLEKENTDPFRALTKRSYDALAKNPTSSIRHLELRNIVPRVCSTWNSPDFQALLNNLSTFTITLRGGENGTGWQFTTYSTYLCFFNSLEIHFFNHLSQLKHLSVCAPSDTSPGLAVGINSFKLPFGPRHVPELQTLHLENLFISPYLSTFVTSHSSLKSVTLEKCYSGLHESNSVDKEEESLSWGAFFSTIAAVHMPALRAFHVGASDLETTQPHEDEGGFQQAKYAKDLREQYPSRRMFEYKQVDEMYGTLYDCTELAFQRFKQGTDQKGWEELCKVLKK
jgi:hypothetical protein